jgi:hypothetical protein
MWSRVCTGGDGTAGNYTEALAMIAAGLDYLHLAAASGEVDESQYAEVLLSLQAAESKHAAARAAFLSRFDAAGCHDSDGYQSSSSWLAGKTGVSRSVAKGQVRQMRNLRDRSRLAAAMSEGWLSESAPTSSSWTRSRQALIMTMSTCWPSPPSRGGGLSGRTQTIQMTASMTGTCG